MTIRTILFCFMLATGSCTTAHKVPVVVAQTGLATTQSIGALQVATTQLTEASLLPPATALQVQETLLQINTKLLPLPEILRTIDRLEAAGSSPDPAIDRAIAILQVVGQDISIVLAGVPLSANTSQLITLVRAAQATVQTTLIEVSKLRGQN